MIQEPSIAPIRISELSKGHAGAQYNLGFMYANSQGVPQDDAEAVRWYRLAADQGIARAQSNLGLLYENGEGVPQDYVQAHMWFNLSASRRTGEDRELIDSVFPLSEVRTAHDKSRSGRAKGKIVLEVVPA